MTNEAAPTPEQLLPAHATPDAPAAEATVTFLRPEDAEASAKAAAEPQTAETTEPAGPWTDGIVKYGSDDRARRDDGKFLSNYEHEQIMAHEGQIRQGYKEMIGDLAKTDTVGRIHRPNGQMMSKHEIASIAAHQEQIRGGLKELHGDDAPDTPDTAEPDADTPVTPDDNLSLEEVWRRLDARQQARARSRRDVTPDAPDPLDTELTSDFEDGEGEGSLEDHFDDVLDIVEPIADTTEPAMRSRLQRMMDKARMWTPKGLAIRAKTRLHDFNEKYYRTPNEELNHRRKVTSVILGGAALIGTGATMYLLAKHGLDFGHHAAEANQPKGGDNGISDLLGVSSTGTHAHEVAQQISLLQGGTVWGSVAENAHQLGYQHLTDTQIHSLTAATLQHMHMSWDQATRLPVGYNVHLLSPAEIKGILG